MSRRVNTTSPSGNGVLIGDSFAERFKYAMRDTTSEALARKIDVSLRTVTRWRSGQNDPKGAELVLLAEALGVDPRELYPPRQEETV